MLYSIWIKESLNEAKQQFGQDVPRYLTLLPSIVYAALVWFMNFCYRKLATYLTEWGMAKYCSWNCTTLSHWLHFYVENHRTQSQFERSRVCKLVLFEFVNNFMSLFYIAFYIQDFEMLKRQLTIMLIAIQSINHIKEALQPLVIRKSFAFVINITVYICICIWTCPQNRSAYV